MKGKHRGESSRKSTSHRPDLVCDRRFAASSIEDANQGSVARIFKTGRSPLASGSVHAPWPHWRALLSANWRHPSFSSPRLTAGGVFYINHYHECGAVPAITRNKSITYQNLGTYTQSCHCSIFHHTDYHAQVPLCIV